MGDYYRPFGHQKAPPWLPKPTPEEERARWAESVIRLELKRDLRRRGIPFAADDSTVLLAAVQELAIMLDPVPLTFYLVNRNGVPTRFFSYESLRALAAVLGISHPPFCFPPEPR